MSAESNCKRKAAPSEFEQQDDDSEEILPDKRFKIDQECVKVEDIKPEIDDQMILPDRDAVNKSPSDPVKHEPVDIETEMDEFDADDFLVVLPRDDDSLDEELLLDPEADNQKGIARTVKPNCGPTCHAQCILRVSDEVRQQLLENLLRMSLNDKRRFINDHICAMPVAKPQSLSSRRMLSNHYFLPVESRLVKVCKKMFISTYRLSDKKIRVILAKKIGDKHVVCGNPNFPALLKKGGKFYFEYDEACVPTVAKVVREKGCKCTLQCENLFSEEVIEQIRSSFWEKSEQEQRNFLSEHVQLLTGKRHPDESALFRARFMLPFGSTVRVVCRKTFLRAFKLTTSQVKHLLSNPPESSFEVAINDAEILPDCDEASKSPKEADKDDPLDIESEFVEALPREDDSVDDDDEGDDHSDTDSQTEILPLGEEKELAKLSRQKRKLRGLSYTSRGGQQWPARVLRPNCGASCQFQCRTRVSDEVRQQLLSKLLALKSHTEQRQFIADHICNVPSSRAPLNKRLFNHYFLPVQSRLVKVCKTMFMNTYVLTDKNIRIVLAKKRGAKHVVCGNPNFPALLKKGGKFDFDYVEGMDASRLHSAEVRVLVDPLAMAKQHIGAHRTDEDHHCAVSGELVKLSRCPNVARIYGEYREGFRGRQGVDPIDYQQFFAEFCRHFAETGLLQQTSCPDCGYFDRGEAG